MNRLNNHSSSSIKQVWHFLFGSMRKNRRITTRNAFDQNRPKAVTGQVSANQLASVNLLRDFIFDGYVTSYNSLKEQAPVQSSLKSEDSRNAISQSQAEQSLVASDYISQCNEAYCCSVS